jgi:hypothetical protein
MKTKLLKIALLVFFGLMVSYCQKDDDQMAQGTFTGTDNPSTVASNVVTASKNLRHPKFTGPTDVRVRNVSPLLLFGVIVNSSECLSTGGIHQLFCPHPGTTNGEQYIAPWEVSEYVRFNGARMEVDIFASVSGIIFTTAPVDFTYLQYIGSYKVTYDVTFNNVVDRRLIITGVTIDGPIE